MKICPQCQAENQDIAKWCKKCAVVFDNDPIETKPVNESNDSISAKSKLRPCIDCQQMVSINAEFCVHCGRHFQKFAIPLQRLDAVSILSRTFIVCTWIASLLSTACGGLIFLSALSPGEGKTIMQEIGTMILGLGIAIVPYCFAKGLSEIAKTGQR